MRIDIFSDIACPWCYIGLTRFLRVLGDFEHADAVDVRLRSFQLDPTLPELYAGSEADYLAASKGLPEHRVRGMFAAVEAAAASEGLALDFDRLVVANSWRAHRLLQAARAFGEPVARDVELALFRAHFVDGEAISDAPTLVRLGVDAGVPREEAERAASGSAVPTTSGDDLDAAVRADLDLARAYGITGVPFFVLADTYGLSGAQPPEAFAEALRQAWHETQPATVSPLAGLPASDGGPACGVDGCS